MKKIITFILCLLTLTTFGQNDNDSLFRNEDYPIDKYSIKLDTFNFNNFQIELIQVRPINYKNSDNSSINCRIWLNVKDNKTIIDKLFINDCEALGGCSGIFVTEEQNLKNHFILSKFGDYDGQIIIIDKSGRIKSYFGGKYFLSPDSKLLFSIYDSDLAGLTIYDFSENKLIFTSDTFRNYLSEFYLYNNEYFAVVSNDVKRRNETEIVTFNLNPINFVKSVVNDDYFLKAKRLKSYNNIIYSPCNCGLKKEL
ncbi:MAG: hypothetical protein KUL74_07280 [Cloacibacterium sp.]|nr:hypothetical protein [Cloacibacterium sp.]